MFVIAEFPGWVDSTWEAGVVADADGGVLGDSEGPATGLAGYMPCIRIVVVDTVQEGSREKVNVMPGVSNTRLRTTVGILMTVPSDQNVNVMGKKSYSVLSLSKSAS